MQILRNLVVAAACLCSLPAFALSDEGRQTLAGLQSRWAEINYRVPKDAREAAFATLGETAEQAVKAEPDAPELLIWRGIILSTWAGAKGGLGALSLVKEARSSFEAALAIDPRALDGSAYTSLGSLYYQVPGWPIGFGDDKQAEAMLQKALEINPSGIDPNYFYGDYLFRQKRYAQARAALLRAQAAPDRPDRALADEGRRGEIRALLGKVEAELH
ncbi:tetratricopeptide repeat protein [Aromatoleum sp.]|uniref:tetratricopeptide repeat protein n=1 Tax=Aromatoleum sp. TaxID=2307007 RepID=UPI002FCC7F09